MTGAQHNDTAVGAGTTAMERTVLEIWSATSDVETFRRLLIQCAVAFVSALVLYCWLDDGLDDVRPTILGFLGVVCYAMGGLSLVLLILLGWSNAKLARFRRTAARLRAGLE